MPGFDIEADVARAVARVQQSAPSGCLFAVLLDNSEASSEMATLLRTEAVPPEEIPAGTVCIILRTGSVDLENFKQMYPVLELPMLYWIAPSGRVLHCLVGAQTAEALVAGFKAVVSQGSDPPEPAPAAPTEARTPPVGVARGEPAAGDTTLPEERIAESADGSSEGPAKPSSTSSTSPSKDTSQDGARDAQMKAAQAKRLKEIKQEQEDRARIREQLRLDQLERQRRAAERSATLGTTPTSATSSMSADDGVATTEKTTAPATERKESTTATSATSNAAVTTTVPTTATTAAIRIRLLDGSLFTHTFSATQTLQDVFALVGGSQNEPCCLVATFPTRRFTEEDHGRTLLELDLAPSASLNCISTMTVDSSRSSEVVSQSSLGSWFGSFLSWFYPSAMSSEPSDLETTRSRQSAEPKSATNVHRLTDLGAEKDDDGTENFDNGNTTQFQG
eukprot:NODE_1581_length_1484_cov_17.559582_g1427_i0.p1 GENE.NODE_1581_length_1484_cov_17.559582_g1427_i0~~NODE_1581_length_1484_cov_17.559582_g1427_i0.p1  ORF type:complete len:450 (+),score=79.01 NODE_1581_length_1484_cov_17.559582_g1427_i0:45-1394(+)